MKSRETELLLVYLIFDLLILNFSILFLASFNNYLAINFEKENLSMYLMHGNLSWVITYFIFSKKNLHLRDGFLNRMWRISKRAFIFFIIASVFAFLIMPKSYSRIFILEYSGINYILKVIFYIALYKYLLYKRKNGMNTNRALIIGASETGQILRKVIESNPIFGYQFIGYLCDKSPEMKDVIGHPEELEEIIDKHNIQIIFVTISIFSNDNKTKDYLKLCNAKGIRLRFIPDNQRWFKNRINMESVGGIVLINPQEIPLDDVGLRVQKRLFDIAFSSLIIIFIFSWLLPILAIIIKLSSKGPVFFVQERTGINNKTFKCLKFRSMYVNIHANTLQATSNDPRITKIGRFMRKTNIDELPQFFNVFGGHMSVVGPRPHMIRHTDEYSQLIKHYMIRHYVKPGITGWAQINGFRGETKELWKMEERVKMDMEYIENWTFVWDLKIIWLTLFGKDVFNNAG